jgi:hypothetical protein
MKRVFFIVSLFAIISSCSSDVKKNDLEEENLKGEVILVTTNSIHTEDESRSGEIYFKVYNDQGMMTKQFSGMLGKFFTLYETIYDNERKVLVKTTQNWGAGISKLEEKYLYNINGKLESFDNQGLNIKHTYNEDGELLKTIMSSEFNWSQVVDYFYSKSKLDSTAGTTKNGDEVSYYTRIFGEDIEIGKRYDVETSGNKVLRVITYLKKDENGNDIEELFDEFNSNGIKIKSTTKKYEYNYDENGNWIQQRQIEEGVLKITTNRTIVYKGGETGIYINEIDKIINSLNGGGNNSNNSTQNNENSSSSNQNNYSNQNQQTERQKQWVNCNKCSGTGKIVCRQCNGTTLMFCGTCDGRGTFNSGNGSTTCYYCKGALKVKCNRCNGKGIEGNCGQCGGRGQVQQ